MKRLILKIFILAFLLGGISLCQASGLAQKPGSEQIKTGSVNLDFNQYRAGLAEPENTFQTEFEFNALGAFWRTQTEDYKIFVSFKNRGDWTGWLELKPIDDFKDGWQSAELYSQIVTTTKTNQFRYKIESSRIQPLKNLTFQYLDTSAGSPAYRAAFSNSQEPEIISRKYWGADESYRFASGRDLWPEKHYKVEKFVIHHTASSSGDEDPASVVRAIYYWHSKILGWGDIGYNYLIDQNGRIYEGRSGGEGVVGGHAYNEQTKTSYNNGSIGIAVIGCYDNGLNSLDNPICDEPDNFNDKIKNSLTELIAKKSRIHQINPLAEKYFKNGKTPNIILHRDVDNTNCPGNLIARELNDIRLAVKTRFNRLGGLKGYEYGGEIVDISETSLQLEPNSFKEIVVKIKNTGNTLWRGYLDDYLLIEEADVKSRLGGISRYHLALSTPFSNPFAENNNRLVHDLSNYGSDSNEIGTDQPLLITKDKIAKLQPTNVWPGQTGYFSLIIQANEFNYKNSKDYVLAWKDRGWFPNTEFTLKASLIEPSGGQNIKSAELTFHNLPYDITAGSVNLSVVNYKNNGNSLWLKNNLKLRLYGPGQSQSAFYFPLWPAETGDFSPIQNVISPGQTAQFNLPLKAPLSGGEFSQTIQIYNNNILVDEFAITTTVAAALSGRLESANWPVALKAGWQPTIKLALKNTGQNTWLNPSLKADGLNGQASPFYRQSWQNGSTVLNSGQEIKPGETLRLEFKIKAPAQAGKYYQVFYLENQGQRIYLNGQDKLVFLSRIDAP